MKRLVLCLIIALVACSVYCQSNYETARTFMLKKGAKLSSDTLGSKKPDGYEVFKCFGDKGYAVVKDDIVVAYSTEDKYKEHAVKATTRELKLTPKYPIEPMIEAEFNQGWEPYTDSLPGNCTVGCGALAVAKIMYYYKIEGCDSIDAVEFGIDDIPDLEALPPTTFNWDNILPRYVKNEYTVEQGKEIAKLMKYVGYAIHSKYTKYSTGSWLLPEWLPQLGFSEESYSNVKSQYEIGSIDWWYSYDEWKISDLELEELLDKELEQGRPVLIGGYDKTLSTGHWQVVDGRDDTGRYHIDDLGYVIVSQDMYTSCEYVVYGVANYINHLWCVIPIVSKNTTSICTANARNEDEAVYNLQGYKVGNSLEGMKKGIYIVKGKKYIVR